MPYFMAVRAFFVNSSHLNLTSERINNLEEVLAAMIWTFEKLLNTSCSLSINR